MKDKERITQLEDTVVKQTVEYASSTEMSVSCNVYCIVQVVTTHI